MKVEIFGKKREEIKENYLSAIDQMNMYSRRSTNWAVTSFFPIGVGIILLILAQSFYPSVFLTFGIIMCLVGLVFFAVSMFYSFQKSDLAEVVRIYEEYYEFVNEFKRKKNDRISPHRSSLESDLQRMEKSWNDLGDEINRVLREVETKINENKK